MNARNKEECKELENKLTEMKNRIHEKELNNEMASREIDSMLQAKRSPADFATEKASDFEQFEHEIKDELKEIEKEIRDQRD